MREFTVMDRIMISLTLFSGLLIMGLQVLGILGVPNTEKSVDFIMPMFIGLVLFTATRVSAVEERRQRRGYEERIETLLKRIATPSTSKRRSSRYT